MFIQTKEFFGLWTVANRTGDIYYSLKKHFYGQEKVLWLSVEGGVKPREKAAYDAVELLLSAIGPVGTEMSLVGEERYSKYCLKRETRALLKMYLDELPMDFVVVRLDIPGMTDYLFFF